MSLNYGNARSEQKRNLEKSIMLLDESLYSPRNSPRQPRSTRHLDQSLAGTMDYEETRVLLSRPALEKAKKRRQTMDMLSFNMTSDFTVTAGQTNVLVNENLEQLFEDFLETFQSYPLDHQVFEQVAKYDSICSEQVLALQKILKTTPQGHWRLPVVREIEGQLRLERDTWRLVASLYQDRLNSENAGDAMEDEDELFLEKFRSEVGFVNKLYEKNSHLRQAQLVVDWLEQKASDLFDESQLQFFGDPVAGWENTLHQLLSKTSDLNLINELDPDAPLRNKGKKLNLLDQEDETRLLRCVFQRLRCGQLEEAQQLFFRAGHLARAAVLEGWRLYEDPNLESEGQNVQIKKSATGNPNRDIWKATAWKACQSGDLAQEERAIYGALCGHLDSLLAVSESWEDVLWSHFRTLVDNIVEREVRLHVDYTRDLEAMPESYWQQQTSVEKIFAALAASRNPKVAAQATDYYRTVQRYVIMDDIDGLLEEMSSWVSKSALGGLDPQLLRLMAHLSLFFRRVGRCSRDDLVNTILQSYVESLVASNSTELIAFYVAQLQTVPSEQVEVFAGCLARTEELEECEEERRKMLLSLADQAGLDINAIACRVVELMCTQGNVEPASDFSLRIPTTPEDTKRIQALGWLLVDDSMRADLLAQANTLMRVFLLRRQMDALKAAYDMIPADTIRTLSDLWQTRAGTLELPVKVQDSIREYICFKAYMDALAAFQDWFSHYYNLKPRPPASEQQGQSLRSRPQLSFAENLVREQQLKQYEADLHRWRTALELVTKTATERLYNVLLFPDGGWMVDGAEESESSAEEESDERVRQMKLLRQTCIPHVAMLLTTVLQDSEQHEQCVRLADIIAAEPQALYKVFTAEQMSRLLAQLRKSYLRVLDKGEDL